MPTLVWIRRSESGSDADDATSRSRGEDAAVPDPVVSAASAAADAAPDDAAAAATVTPPAFGVPRAAAPAAGPLAYRVPVPPWIAVPPTFTAHTMVLHYQHQQQRYRPLLRRHVTADGGTTTKRKTNRAGQAIAAKKRSKATSKRDLPTGVYQQPSGNFQSVIRCRGKIRHIGTFDTLDRASAARASVEKELALAKLAELGPDEVNAVFDAAQVKAIDAVSGVGPKKKKRKATSLRGHPLGFTQNATGKFVSHMYWGGNNRYIGTFDTPDQASTVSWLVRRDLDNANASTVDADEVDATFNAAKTRALDAVGVSKQKELPSSMSSQQPSSILLSTSADATWLSPSLCLLRSQIEYFGASPSDFTAKNRSGGNKAAVVIGQVGIRCIWCNHRPRGDRAKGSELYPSNIGLIHQAVRNYQR